MVKKIEDLTLMELIERARLKQLMPFEDKDERLPTGIFSLDEALGGGWIKGGIHEIWGEPGYGKSLLAMISAGAAINHGNGPVIWLDTEFAFDNKWALNFLDIQSENFILLRLQNETTAEEVLEFIRKAINKKVSMIVLDSKDAMVFAPELEGQISDANMGIRSRRFGNFIRIVNQSLLNTDVVFIFISQVRINMDSRTQHYSRYTTSGGMALEHHSVAQVHMRSRIPLKDKDNIAGYIFCGRVERNRRSQPGKEFEFKLQDFEIENKVTRLFDRWSDLFEAAKNKGIFRSSAGDIYAGRGKAIFENTVLGGSRDEIIAFLWDNPDVVVAIEKALRNE